MLQVPGVIQDIYEYDSLCPSLLIHYFTVHKCKGKGSSLDIAPLIILDSGTLQPQKWQLTVVLRRKLVAAHSPC